MMFLIYAGSKLTSLGPHVSVFFSMIFPTASLLFIGFMCAYSNQPVIPAENYHGMQVR